MKAQPPFSLPTPTSCKLLYDGRSLHSRLGGVQAGSAYHKRGHRLCRGLAPYHPCRVPHLPGAYCKTIVAQLAFLPWYPFYATLRLFFREVELSLEGNPTIILRALPGLPRMA